MDRLSTLSTCAAWLAAALSVGCGKGDQAAAPAKGRQRVNAVAAKPKEINLDDLCENRFQGADAPAFSFPALAAGAPPTSSGWKWVNVWATWCKPCVAEIPMLVKWQEKLAGDGVTVNLTFLSVDADETTVQSFRETHVDVPESLRIADVEQLGPWLATYGLQDTSVLPIHMFIDSAGKLRCVRMGELSEDDYDLVKHLAAG